MTGGPTRAEVLAAPHRDADTEIRKLLQAAEDCQPEWQDRPTRTTTLPDLDDYEEPTVTEDLSKRIAAALREHGMVHLGDQVPADEYDCCGEVALAAIQGAYVPPPPGSDRDKLPDWITALVSPFLRPYTSTGCESAAAIRRVINARYSDRTAELAEWEQREHASCRLTRKQDMAACRCDCHQGGGR